MRSLRLRLLAVPVAALLGATAIPLEARPEGDAPATSFESVGGLYASAELGLGGRPLYQRLFPNGWPTTRDFRALTIEDGESAFADSVGAFLGSGLGVPLEVSTYERWVFQQRQDNEKGKAPGTVAAHLATRWEAFRQAAGLADKPEGFNPVFLPYRRGDPIPEKAFDEAKPTTWSWQTKGQDTAITMDAIGLGMYAYTLFAEQQLALEHKVEVAGTTNTYAGRSDVDGFLGFTALECATAQLRELRDKLCMDAKGGPDGKPALGPIPKNYDANISRGEGLNIFFPHGIAAKVNRATATYDVGATDVDKKMRLFDQAALILGLTELAKVAQSKTGAGKFFAPGKKGAAFAPEIAEEATDVAVFVARSLRYVSWNPTQGGCCSSFSTAEAGHGTTLRVEDAGLLLVALEQFLSMNAGKNDKLAAAQKDMAFVADRVTTVLESVQKQSNPPGTGFCDTYDLGGQSPADLTKTGAEKRSLFAQGLVVRGLLAAKRMSDLAAYNGPNVKKHPEAKEAALAVLKWLEEKRWDKARRAYVDEPGKGTRSRATDAAAVLGALRDMALDTSDARYLLRYKAYLGTLRARGLLFAETARGRALLGPDAAAPGGLKTPAEAGRAPVVAAEVNIP